MTQQPTTAPNLRPDQHAPTDGMRGVIARTIENALKQPADGPGGDRIQDTVAEAVYAVVQPLLGEVADYRNRLAWETTCGSCARTLDAAYAETTRAETAEARLQALTEAVVLWRDRPNRDVGLAIALGSILDADKPEPPAATAVVQALRECDRIEREQPGRWDEDTTGTREAVRRIRTALGEATAAGIDTSTVPPNIRTAQERAWANKVAKGFNTTDVPLEFGLLTAEIGEAFTAWRKGLPDFGEELADVLLYLAALAEMTGVDLGGEVARKIEKNTRRQYERNEHGAFIRVETNSDPSKPHPDGRP